MRRTRLAKKSKTPIAKSKEILWDTVKALIRKRDGNKCFICGKSDLSGAGWHGGHFIPSSTCGMFLRYDIRNVHSSCYYCNINLGGNGAMFYKRLAEEYNQDFVNKLFIDKNKTVKWDISDLERMTEYHKKLLDKTPKQLISFTKKYNGFE